MAVNPLMSSGPTSFDAVNSGVNGIRAGLRGMDHAAQEIAELNLRGAPGTAPPGGAPPDRLQHAADAITDLMVYQRHVQAAAVVVETADAVLGFLLDVRA